MELLIDPHVHLRDWNQAEKETLHHGFSVAWRAGISALFEMPNTDPPLTRRREVERRIAEADAAAASVRTDSGAAPFHGLYVGLTGDADQVEEAIAIHRDHFPRVVGMKLYAGHSTGRMGVTAVQQQLTVWRTLGRAGFRGVVALHAEREDLLRPELWDPMHPETHSDARPALAEVASVQTQLALAEASGFRGTLHVCHISTPDAVELVRREAGSLPFRVVCGATPHHLLLSRDTAAGAAQASDRQPAASAHPIAWFNVNPPLRTEPLREAMLRCLLEGRIDWIESDHAPHTAADKQAGASGLPGFLGLRLLADRLAEAMPDDAARLCADAVLDVFEIPRHLIPANPALQQPVDRPALAREYPWDPYASVDRD